MVNTRTNGYNCEEYFNISDRIIMAYRKRTYRKKPRKGNYVAKVVNKILAKRVEDKYHDIFGTSLPGAGTYFLQLLNGLTQSTGDAGRIGNEVCNTSVHMKLSVSFPDATNNGRILVFWDKQPNGAVPVAADLLTYPASPVDSFLNPDSKARFQVLKDILVSGGANGPVAKSYNWQINLRHKRTMFKGTTDAIASISTNALYVMFMNDSAVIPHPTFTYMIRTVYSDM